MKTVRILSVLILVLLLTSCYPYRYGRRRNSGQGGSNNTEQYQPGGGQDQGGSSTSRRSGYDRSR